MPSGCVAENRVRGGRVEAEMSGDVRRGRAGRKITGSTLAIYYTGGRPTRFGIGVSKKQGGAVDRNRLKRTVREFLRQNRAIWPVDKWVLIRFERRSPGSQRPESRLEFIDELERLLKKIR